MPLGWPVGDRFDLSLRARLGKPGEPDVHAEANRIR
jgi:hypothetical protein